MTSLAEKLARPEIVALAENRASHALRDDSNSLCLDANESARSFINNGSAFVDINRYPHPQPADLVARFADIYGVENDNILIGRGTDEAIDLLLRVFCRAGQDAIVICPPTFSYYETAAAIQGAAILRVPMTQKLTVDFAALERAVKMDKRVKLIFLCSPMNPTGGAISADQVLDICETLDQVIIVVDEAYIEFASLPSLAPQAAKRENLVVLRTLSKAYGLAGARCGVAIAQRQLITLLRKIQAPYPLAGPSGIAAREVLSPIRAPILSLYIDEIVDERTRLYKALKQSPHVVRVFESDANFLFLETKNTQQLKGKLAARGIRLCWRDDVVAGGVRLTIGSAQENDLVLEAFGIAMPATDRRHGEVHRATKETQISVLVDLDRADKTVIETGIGFFDHMLEQIAKHGDFSLILSCEGDHEVDAHHTIEDCMLAFGEALRVALGDKRGLDRFGFALPMDEAAAEILIDLSGRPSATFEGCFSASHIGDYPTEMTAHAFRSLADALGAAIQVKVQGENDHHMTEACFKALGRALKMAIRVEGISVASTKGVLM